jgi:hypothetical protein
VLDAALSSGSAYEDILVELQCVGQVGRMGIVAAQGGYQRGLNGYFT